MKYNYCYILLIVLLFSCAKADSDFYGFYPAFDGRQTEFSDDEILEAAYNDYYYPSHFYQSNDIFGAALRYEVVPNIVNGLNETATVEQCSDNAEEAKKLSQASVSVNNSGYNFDQQSETEKYYQFKYKTAGERPDVLLSRIHKCSYINRFDYDKTDRSQSSIGVFNKEEFNLSDVKELVEYVWFIDNVNKKVLSSFTEERDDEFVHFIYELAVEIGDIGQNDSLILNELEYTIKKNTGSIQFNLSQIKELTGRLR